MVDLNVLHQLREEIVAECGACDYDDNELEEIYMQEEQSPEVQLSRQLTTVQERLARVEQGGEALAEQLSGVLTKVLGETLEKALAGVKAPIVKMDAPRPVIHVHMPKVKAAIQTVERDGDGEIVRTRTEYEYED